MTKTIQAWGYHATEKPRVFDLKEGESLPEGWFDSPAKVNEDKPRNPFDHDGDGKPGGSLPKSQRGRPRKRKG